MQKKLVLMKLYWSRKAPQSDMTGVLVRERMPCGETETHVEKMAVHGADAELRVTQPRTHECQGLLGSARS